MVGSAHGQITFKGSYRLARRKAFESLGTQTRRKVPAADRRGPGREQEYAEVPELLAQGAPAHGFRGHVWTCERVAEVIWRNFEVRYHPAHVSRLLKAFRQSLQKPGRRANQRDEQTIRRWKEERWPSLKKGR